MVAIGALAAACAPGNRAASFSSTGVTPAPLTASTVPPEVSVPAAAGPGAPSTSAPAVAPGAAATQDPQTAAEAQAAETMLSQIESDLAVTDQSSSTGENDVPSN